MSKQDLYKRIELIHHTKREIQPDPAWVLRTRQTLLMQVANSMPPAKASLGARIGGIFSYFFPSRLIAAIRGPVLATLSIAGVVTGGSIASVSAAENAIPGDLLYPVKLATEQTRLILAKSTSDKLKLKTEFVERRGAEMKTIATSDRPEKQQQLKDAAQSLRRDLDTVKLQLTEISHQESSVQAAESAKLVDQKSSELAVTLKDVKVSVSDEVRADLAEAEVAAVNTGTKAVQLLIETQQDPAAQGVVTREELLQSIHVKVQGLEQNITDAAQRISGSTSTILTLTATGTAPLPSGSSTASSSDLVLSAHHSLEQTKQLLQENKLGEINDRLTETIQAIATMEASVAATPMVASSTPAASSTSSASGASVIPSSTSQ